MRSMAQSRSQRRAVNRYRQLLELAGLSEPVTIERNADDPDAIVPAFNSMSNQIVRSSVVSAYTLIDELLNHEVLKHFFGSGDRLRRARRTKRFRTLQIMLQQVFLLQKLALVENFRVVPREISSHIRALNDLRNGVAHSFSLDGLPAVKRTFKKQDVFTVKGFEFFLGAMNEVDYFFMPYLAKIYGELGADA